jgi:hypothetical protein
MLFVIYRMWWNLNPFCNIFYLRCYIYILFIFCFSSVSMLQVADIIMISNGR